MIVVSLFLDLCYLLALLLASPILLYKMIVRGKYWRTFPQRLGFARLRRADIWIHGVSVGEINSARPLVEKLAERYQVVVSSTSSRGLETAHKLYPQHQIINFPFDFSWAVRRCMKMIQPRLVVLMELELWPNFLLAMEKYKIPVLLVNGRLSQQSAQRYLYWSWGFSRATRSIRYFCMQNEIYCERLQSLGISSERLRVTGNMKFDAVRPELASAQQRQLIDELALVKNRVIVAGSTHWPEEKFIVDSFSRLKGEFPQLKLLLVPRHPERTPELIEYMRENGLQAIPRSDCKESPAPPEIDVLIGDVMGELSQLYTVAELVFVGGSLIPHGGQNFIEPASLGKPVVCGPFMNNFPDIHLFLEKRAIFQIQSPQQLTQIWQELLQNPQSARQVGETARQLVEQYRGSVEKNYTLCQDLMIS